MVWPRSLLACSINIGNVLNSVNASSEVVAERVRGMKISGVPKAVESLKENIAALGSYFTEDERGQHMIPYLDITGKTAFRSSGRGA